MRVLKRLGRHLREPSVPAGLIGRNGGTVMASQRQGITATHIGELLDIQPGNKVLEVGFGQGEAIECLNDRLAGKGLIVHRPFGVHVADGRPAEC